MSSPLVYFLSLYKAPAGMISSITSIFNIKKIGGCCEEHKKIDWVSWDSICLPKEGEGLGVKRLEEFNLSLFGKWCWRMLIDRDGLWYRVLKVRYYEEGDFVVLDGGGRFVMSEGAWE